MDVAWSKNAKTCEWSSQIVKNGFLEIAGEPRYNYKQRTSTSVETEHPLSHGKSYRFKIWARFFSTTLLTDRISFACFISGLEARELLGALPLIKNNTNSSGWKDMIGLV